jgi:hypothetical protein
MAERIIMGILLCYGICVELEFTGHLRRLPDIYNIVHRLLLISLFHVRHNGDKLYYESLSIRVHELNEI